MRHPTPGPHRGDDTRGVHKHINAAESFNGVGDHSQPIVFMSKIGDNSFDNIGFEVLARRRRVKG